MKRKVLAMILSMSMLVGLTACGSSTGTASGEAATAGEAESSVASAAEEESAETTSAESTE